MQKTFIFLLLFFSSSLCYWGYSQRIPLPENLPQGHPRLLTTDVEKDRIQKQISEENWAEQVWDGILKRINPFVEKTLTQPDWLYSRMMMYWKSKATQVYINGGVYSHADGEAPVPTVHFGSTRGVSSVYKRPNIDNITPYMDDTQGVFFHNTAKNGHPLEWVDPANVSGNSIESINEEIMRLAKDASFVYWLTGDEKYARFAFDIFNTYMLGMYYRDEPIDLGNGHAQTLAGLSTFEVIQERILNELAYTYDFLWHYITQIEQEEIKKLPLEIQDLEGLKTVYESTFKKWINLTIKHGVPQNNWNLHQAKFILKVAMVLENNTHYDDGKGREYYIDYILNQNSARQWSLTQFMDYGYDATTGIWNECPGYAQGVTKDLTNFIRDYDNTFNQNLLPYTPVMKQAVKVLPQYLFPNGDITAFGDSYYGGLNTEAVSDMIRLAQKYDNREDEVEFTRLFRLLNPKADRQNNVTRNLAPQVFSFFTSKPLDLDGSIEAGKISDYVTNTFYAPNVSWMVQRNKFEDAQNALMISQYASYGNHAHSNGIAMELYGKGYVLGAESGIGSSYFEKPYLEYYSQFPAHNTVMVDGISKYPEMLSNHPFDLLACYPQPGKKSGYYTGISYSEVYFLEPESRSDQNRLLSIVRTGENTGYYVDIFRSKKQKGGDKFHDYFYHNLGQELFIQDAKGKDLDLQASDAMAFAGGHLFALDYMWDKQAAKTTDDYQAIWKMSKPDGNHVYMNLWMKGYEGREVFSIKAPPCKAFRPNHNLPYDVLNQPFLTIAARQYGEAWNHPFVSVFEPTTENEGRSIASIQSFDVKNAAEDFVGILVTNQSGRKDYIFSSSVEETVKYNQMHVKGTYALISEIADDFTLFLGNGTFIQAKGITIETIKNSHVVLTRQGGEFYLSCDAPVLIKTSKKKKGVKFNATDYQLIDL